MKMYCVYEEEIMVEDEQSYYTYGIAAPNGERVGDICVVRGEVEALAEQMNRCGAEPVHMQDVVADWLDGR